VLVPNQRGLERALAAGARHVAVFASATEAFSQRNLGCSLADAHRRHAGVAVAALAAGVPVRGYVSMCFGDPWEGAVPVDAVRRAVDQLVDLGCHQVSVGDTIGVATPGHVRDVVAACTAGGLAPERLALHCHDTYGQALANVLAGLQAGITTVDASAGGLGGCPFAGAATGNLATEDLLWMLHGLGIATGVDLAAVVDASRWLAGHLGRSSPSRVVAALGSELARRTGATDAAVTAAARGRATP
jgi:hydroxymethylglutaryl-CoA lyase